MLRILRVRSGRENAERRTWRPATSYELGTSGATSQSGYRGAQMRLGCVPKLDDQWMPLECLLDEPALDALAAPVNQSYFPESLFVGGFDVLGDH